MKCWSWIRQQPPTVIDTAARIQSLYYNCCLPQMTCWKSVTMKTYYSLIRCHNLAWHTQEKIHTTYTVWSLCLLSNLQLFYQRWKSNEGLQAVSPGLRFVSLLWPLIMPALGEPEGIGGGVMWHSALLATSPPPPTLPSCVPGRWFKSVYLCFATASLQGWAWCITFGPGAMASLAVTRAAAWTSSSPPPPPFLFSYQRLIIRREKERKQQLHLEPQKFAGCSLFISSYLVFQYNTVISLDWLGP